MNKQVEYKCNRAFKKTNLYNIKSNKKYRKLRLYNMQYKRLSRRVKLQRWSNNYSLISKILRKRVSDLILYSIISVNKTVMIRIIIRVKSIVIIYLWSAFQQSSIFRESIIVLLRHTLCSFASKAGLQRFSDSFS